MGTDDESLIVSGQSLEDFLVAFPHVGGDGFEAALRYAASNVQRELAG
jgi:hypothetical protein